MGNANLIQWVPNSLKQDDFWIQLFEVLEEEFNLFRTEKVDPLALYFDIANNDDLEDLVDVAISYGFLPDRSVDETLDSLKFDVLSVGHRKRFLTTYTGYEYIYKSLGYNGDIFILYYNGLKLVRALSASNIANIEAITDYTIPYTFLAERNYAEFFAGDARYDNDPLYQYDAGVNYDTALFRRATKHIGIEYGIDKIVTVDTVEYLMTNTILEYLRTGANYNRRAIEVPHCGSQLTFFMDESGLFDSLSGGGDNDSMPSLKVKSSVIPSIYSAIVDISAFRKMKLGTGTQSMVSSGGGSYPSALAEYKYESLLEEDEVTFSPDGIIVQTMIGIDAKIDYSVSLSSTITVDTSILNVPIRRGSLKVKYIFSGETYEVYDDGLGNITGFNINSGTINYDTGKIDIEFSSLTSGAVLVDFIHNSPYDRIDPNFTLTEITEAGLFNENDEMIAYATFPPIQYDDNRFHNSFQFVVVNPTIA